MLFERFAKRRERAFGDVGVSGAVRANLQIERAKTVERFMTLGEPDAVDEVAARRFETFEDLARRSGFGGGPSVERAPRFEVRRRKKTIIVPQIEGESVEKFETATLLEHLGSARPRIKSTVIRRWYKPNRLQGLR